MSMRMRGPNAMLASGHFMRRVLLGILLAGMLSACAGVSRLEKGSLTAFGELHNGAHEPRYYLVRINVEKAADPRTMSSLVKLNPEAPPLSIAELRPESVARYLQPFSPPPQWPDSLKQKAKEYDDYHGGGFYIAFKNGRLVSVGICSHCAGGRESPIVGTPDGQQFYTLPLTELQVAEVYGSPDRIRKVREVTY
jgi:hypothetical protein